MDFDICNVIITCNYYQQHASLGGAVLQECIRCPYQATELWVICYFNILDFTTFPQVAIKSLLEMQIKHLVLRIATETFKSKIILRKSTAIILYEYRQNYAMALSVT